MPRFVNGNGEPPPSTLAAQIVHNIETANDRPGGNARAHLQELLQMILQGEVDDSSASQRALDETLDENYRLITVIVKACLEPLCSDDPFVDRSALRRQARDSLSVVDLTIRRSPDVLFRIPTQQTPSVSYGGPLFLWLIPHLINSVRTEDEDVLSGTNKIIETALWAQRRPASLIYGRQPVLRYIRGCMRDLIAYAKSQESAGGDTRTVINHIPTAETLSETCSNDYGLGQNSVVNFQVVAQDLLIVARLCLTLVPSPSTKGSKIKMPGADSSWIIDCMSSLWSSCCSMPSSDAKAFSSMLHSMLEGLTTLLRILSRSDHETVTCSRAAILACHVSRKALPQLLQHHSEALEKSLCWAVAGFIGGATQSPIIFQSFCEQLEPLVEDILEDQPRLDSYGQDLQRTLVLASHLTGHNETEKPEEVLLQFSTPELRQAFEPLLQSGATVTMDGDNDLQSPPKRARKNAADQFREPILLTRDVFDQEIYKFLNIAYDQEHDSLELAVETYKVLGEDEQYALFDTLGRAACRSSQDLSESKECPHCDGAMFEGASKPIMDEGLCKQVYDALVKLVRVAQDLKTPRPRVAAMMALRRFLNHSSNHDFFDIRVATLGQWCYSSLKSTVRDLRLAAIATVRFYIQDGVDEDCLDRNRPFVLDQLRLLAEKDDPSLQEICILGFSKFVSYVSSEEEINISLIRLVEYLGSPNPLISGIANEELLKICKYDQFHAQEVFEPYWRSVSIAIVRNLQKRPQIAQSICDMLGIHVSEFLRRTQFFTVPYLVLTKQRDTLQKIAAATGPGHTIFSICISQAQLASILSYLLIQPSKDVEAFVKSLLIEASPEFANHDLSELLKVDGIYTGYELLKFAGEPDQSTKARARQVLHYLADVNLRKPSSSRTSSGRKQDTLASFLEKWALGIVQILSEIIGQTKRPQPMAERKRCVGAIQEMAILAKSQLCHALPQICSCLRSAIEDKDICNEALSAWLTLLKTLDEDYIAVLIDPTFAILAQHWSSFNLATQQEAHDVIDFLFKSHKELVRDIIETIPSVSSVPLLSKFAGEIERFRTQMDPKRQLEAFCLRCQSENDTVVLRTLSELEQFLINNQSFLLTTSIYEQPDAIIGETVRALLDACVRFKDISNDIALQSAKCLGLIGCIDPTRVETIRVDPEIFVLSNFGYSEEVIEFIMFFLQEVLVKAYLTTTITSRQQLLAFGMQELLKICDFDASMTFKRDSDNMDTYKRWISLPESTRNILTPFLTSKYKINALVHQPDRVYPIYSSDMDYSFWLRTFTMDLLQKGRGTNATMVFDVSKRLVRNQDIAIASFVLPYVMLNVIVEGTEEQRLDIVRELYTVLAQPLAELDQAKREDLVVCSQNAFRCIDYLSRWIQEKFRATLRTRSRKDTAADELQIRTVGAVIKKIPPKVISRRAVECKSFARALFHWEQYIREQEEIGREDTNDIYEQLQEIYMQIDEPDGIEGISSCIHGLTMEQQILEDRKAGRWTAVQNWYEVELEQRPDDLDVQWNLLMSLKESGQHDVLLNQVANLKTPVLTAPVWRPFAIEASWNTGNWQKLQDCIDQVTVKEQSNFSVGIGRVLSCLELKDYTKAGRTIEQLLLDGTRALSRSNTSSIQACHDFLLRFHVLVELEAISGIGTNAVAVSPLQQSLGQRLEVLGAFSSYKQYLLGVRRAAMMISILEPSVLDISSTYLTSAKLARKAGYLHQASNAVLHASLYNDTSATIEHSRLTWSRGHHRKAIQTLRGAIEANAFRTEDAMDIDEDQHRNQRNPSQRQNMVAARAQLLLAKWMDGAGQTQSTDIVGEYKKVTSVQTRWEKGHYHLAKHYNKLLESEKSNPIEKRSRSYLEGDLAKLCIENYLRGLPWGSKYIYQALPKVLTLWLDFGVKVEHSVDKHISQNLNPEEIFLQRKKIFNHVQAQMKKYIDRLPAYVFYTAFAQIVARICHPNRAVANQLVDLVAKVVATHAQQAMWPLLAMINSRSSAERAQRGIQCKTKAIEYAKKVGNETNRADFVSMLNQGMALSKQLLHVCNRNFEGQQAPRGPLSLSKDIGFNHSKAAPCRLVIPIEAALLANLPPPSEVLRGHKPFSKDAITIAVFLDEFTVLNSLAKPRRVRVRGSDGKVYTILCKPKDDLRKDQRLLEFNSMISRTLKKDPECSKRRLYIKTYTVTPLNEEHGLVEWVEGMKTLREIFIEAYKEKQITIDYNTIRQQLNEATIDPSQIRIFTRDVLGKFRPVLHEWFVNMFPEPGAWLAARLRYTRSCAVMSMVGHVLGLGDRHAENILLEEAQGGTFHVDFNCLFDKGKTFETAERVPFRLTHNMVDAFGVYRENGPFRKSCELTLRILRQYEDTLMTILETFLYDPTTDFIGKKRKVFNPEVPDTPEGVLDNIRRKVRGLPHGESVPLSEEGYVDLQIAASRDPWNLARMYIGWCPFF